MQVLTASSPVQVLTAGSHLCRFSQPGSPVQVLTAWLTCAGSHSRLSLVQVLTAGPHLCRFSQPDLTCAGSHSQQSPDALQRRVALHSEHVLRRRGRSDGRQLGRVHIRTHSCEQSAERSPNTDQLEKAETDKMAFVATWEMSFPRSLALMSATTQRPQN